MYLRSRRSIASTLRADEPCGSTITVLWLPAEAAQEKGEELVFRSQTRLVTMSCHVTKGKSYVNDLKSSDVVLLEDGKLRPFTIFDAPSAKDRIPFELVLLFDANPAILPLWDPNGVYRFLPQWNESMSRSVLESESAIVRVSVYRCGGDQLVRSNAATGDARTLTDSLLRMLSPEVGASEMRIMSRTPRRSSFWGIGMLPTSAMPG